MTFFLTSNDKLADALREAGHIVLTYQHAMRPIEAYARIDLSDVFVLTRSTIQSMHLLGYAIGKGKRCVTYRYPHKTVGIKICKTTGELIRFAKGE